MKTLMLILGAFLICFSFTSCDSDDSASCEKQVLIGEKEYETFPDDDLTINSVELNGDCMKINFSASGCDGDSWELELIDRGVFFFTNTLQKYLRLSLKNEELCAAYITKELTVDISEIQAGNGNDILMLNLMGYEGQIEYEY